MAISRALREKLTKVEPKSKLLLVTKKKARFWEILQEGSVVSTNTYPSFLRRLKELGIDPQSIRLPPPIALIGDDQILQPQDPPTGQNIGFFERMRRGDENAR